MFMFRNIYCSHGSLLNSADHDPRFIRLQFVQTGCFSRWQILLRLVLNIDKSNCHGVSRRQQSLGVFSISFSWVGSLMAFSLCAVMKGLNFRVWLSWMGAEVNFYVFCVKGKGFCAGRSVSRRSTGLEKQRYWIRKRFVIDLVQHIFWNRVILDFWMLLYLK